MQQVMGCFKIPGLEEDEVSPGHAFLCGLVEESRRPGNFVENLIDTFVMNGRLLLPANLN